MRKLLSLLSILFFFSTFANANGQRTHTFTAAAADIAISNIGSGIAYHKITWTKTGTVSACSVKLQQSVDSVSWTDLIASQTCTSSGVSTVTNISANYIRMNMTAFTGTGSVAVIWNGYTTNPSAGGGVTSITGTANQIAASASTGAITLSFPTNVTLPGTTTGTFSGNITGNVTGNVVGTASLNLALAKATQQVIHPTADVVPIQVEANTDAGSAHMYFTRSNGTYITFAIGQEGTISWPHGGQAYATGSLSVTADGGNLNLYSPSGVTTAQNGLVAKSYLSSDAYYSATNCADAAGAAACGSAAAGAFVMDAAATTVTVSTTAVTANSRIFIQEEPAQAAELGITCNTTIARTYAVTTRTASTSFVVTASAAPVANPACLVYHIIN
jgi:hypothetical protein